MKTASSSTSGQSKRPDVWRKHLSLITGLSPNRRASNPGLGVGNGHDKNPAGSTRLAVRVIKQLLQACGKLRNQMVGPRRADAGCMSKHKPSLFQSNHGLRQVLTPQQNVDVLCKPDCRSVNPPDLFRHRVPTRDRIRN